MSEYALLEYALLAIGFVVAVTAGCALGLWFLRAVANAIVLRAEVREFDKELKDMGI